MTTEPLHDVVVCPARTRPPTPVTLTAFDDEFCRHLDRRLHLLREILAMRESLYGPHAAEWRPAHTPSYIRTQFQTEEHQELRHFMANMTPPTPSTCCHTPPNLDPSTGSPSSSTSPLLPITPLPSRLSLPSSPQHSLKRNRADIDEEESGRTLVKRLQPSEPRARPRRSSRLLEQNKSLQYTLHIPSPSSAPQQELKQAIPTTPKRTPRMTKRKFNAKGKDYNIDVPLKWKRRMGLRASATPHPPTTDEI